MYSLEYIEHLSDEATERACKDKQEPYVFWDGDTVERSIGRIPNLGSHIPKDWEAYGDALMVDNSGMGGAYELALTAEQCIKKVKEIIEDTDYMLGWAIVETGQFQVYIQAFKRTDLFIANYGG